jgi:hypothetical protein
VFALTAAVTIEDREVLNRLPTHQTLAQVG